jgi:hypothetical protein
MKPLPLAFDLPTPWTAKRFETQHVGAVNFLVGPNGSGKSRFAEQLKDYIPDARLLGTDRLRGMEKNSGMGFLGDTFGEGFRKNLFKNFRSAGRDLGFGIDTLVLLEEKLWLRVQVEATLSHLFDRRIMLEWDSGYLIPKAVLGSTGTTYRLDRDECHGIKELLVLLTHLYNDQNRALIIDEPELNLHPQFQAFFMEEVRKIAGDPDSDAGKKLIFLITHSPFILDFRSIDDVKSVISFDLKHSVPKHLFDMDERISTELSPLVPRLNVHHKQLFFSDNPIFVEGILDAQMIEAIQNARRVSVAGAGSCVIDVGGGEEVNKYLLLCRNFGKEAYFVYDMDSLFLGNLRFCLRGDEEISDFLATLGLGADLGRYCGELDRKLTDVIRAIKGKADLPVDTEPLRAYFLELFPGDAQLTGKNLGRARVAFLVHMHRFREPTIRATSANDVRDIEGRLTQIVTALRERKVMLLPGGALEHYLPSYEGDLYRLKDDAKRVAVVKEIGVLASGMSDTDLTDRYGEFLSIIKLLPAKQTVETDKTLLDYLSKYIHDLQNAFVKDPEADGARLAAVIELSTPGISHLFTLQTFERTGKKQFSATIRVRGRLGDPDRYVPVTHQTNAGMQDFRIAITPPAVNEDRARATADAEIPT